MTIQEKILACIRDIPDFPKEGILFKDITPLLKDVHLSREITLAMANYWKSEQIDVIAGIESRGFIWGNALAQEIGVPFVPIRKAGKLPARTYSYRYDLEYGTEEIEIHQDGITEGQRVLIHDDLLATGGTAEAAAELINMPGGVVAGFTFLVALGFLNGEHKLKKYGVDIHALVSY